MRRGISAIEIVLAVGVIGLLIIVGVCQWPRIHGRVADPQTGKPFGNAMLHWQIGYGGWRNERVKITYTGAPVRFEAIDGKQMTASVFWIEWD